MRKINNKLIGSFNDHLNVKYGKPGTTLRDKFNKKTQSFNLGLIVKEARSFRNLTQEELAQKSGTTKYYISRIEHNASDIRLSTLMRIIYEGLDCRLQLV